MPNNIFFAWQLDTPAEHNKKFIWEALQQAIQNLSNTAQPEQSPRPETDTQGVPGSPNIVQEIFKRIRECSIFVADLSFVASTERGKKIPNPNVLIELGYAARSIGWDRTILVMNEAFGQSNDLPFDILQHRHPIEYRITDQTTVGDKRFNDLASTLAVAISDCEQHSLSRAVEMAEGLDTATIDFIARNEKKDFIEFPLRAKTTGELLEEMDFNLVVRRLMELNALQITNIPYIAYAWTYDGHRMIDEVNKTHPGLLNMFQNDQQ